MCGHGTPSPHSPDSWIPEYLHTCHLSAHQPCSISTRTLHPFSSRSLSQLQWYSHVPGHLELCILKVQLSRVPVLVLTVFPCVIGALCSCLPPYLSVCVLTCLLTPSYLQPALAFHPAQPCSAIHHRFSTFILRNPAIKPSLTSYIPGLCPAFGSIL